ncbi:hypothetical protein FPOAC2_13709 [Fusarium poae]
MMKAVLWFFSLSLASATCPSKYAIWISQDRSMVRETLGQALPDIDYDQISVLNPGVDFNMVTVPGKQYKIPYHTDMVLVPPASWSSDCPRKLELNSREFKKLSSTGRSMPTLTNTIYDPSTSKLTRPFPEKDYFGAVLIPRARPGSTTERSKAVETPGITQSRTTPNAATGTATPMICREETHPSVPKFVSSSRSRVQCVRSFCDRLQDVTVDVGHPIDPLTYGDTFIGMQILPSCPKHSVGEKDVEACRGVLENINRNCPKAGGVYSSGCVTYYLLRK